MFPAARSLAERTRETGVTVNTLQVAPTWTDGVDAFMHQMAEIEGTTPEEMSKAYFAEGEGRTHNERRLTGLREGVSYLICHPARDGEELRAITAYQAMHTQALIVAVQHNHAIMEYHLRATAELAGVASKDWPNLFTRLERGRAGALIAALGGSASIPRASRPGANPHPARARVAGAQARGPLIGPRREAGGLPPPAAPDKPCCQSRRLRWRTRRRAQPDVSEATVLT